MATQISYNEKNVKANILHLEGLQSRINQAIEIFNALPEAEPVSTMDQVIRLLNDPSTYIFETLTQGKSFEIGGLSLDKQQLKQMVKMPISFESLAHVCTKIQATLQSKSDVSKLDVPATINDFSSFFQIKSSLIVGEEVCTIKQEKLIEIEEKNKEFLQSIQAEKIYELAKDFTQLISDLNVPAHVKFSMYDESNLKCIVEATVHALLFSKNGININFEWLKHLDRNGVVGMRKLIV